MQPVGGVTAVQLKLMALEEDTVGVSPVGVDGTAVHTGVAGVVASICADAAEEPSASRASTTK